MTLSNLGWLSKIFNDTKRRAVSQRQLSFLLISTFIPRSQELLTLALTLELPAWKTPRKQLYVQAMTYEGALLLAADQTPLAARDLLTLATSLVCNSANHRPIQRWVIKGHCPSTFPQLYPKLWSLPLWGVFVTSHMLLTQCDRRKLLMTLSARLRLQHVSVTLADENNNIMIDNLIDYSYQPSYRLTNIFKRYEPSRGFSAKAERPVGFCNAYQCSF